jgi:nucleoside-diphosphate-sugar epimerase
MAGHTRAVAFITGADGFIGTELVKVLVARGHQVFGLAPSVAAAQRVRRAGAVPVMGDLLVPASGRTRPASDWVFHLPTARGVSAVRMGNTPHPLPAHAY